MAKYFFFLLELIIHILDSKIESIISAINLNSFVPKTRVVKAGEPKRMPLVIQGFSLS